MLTVLKPVFAQPKSDGVGRGEVDRVTKLSQKVDSLEMKMDHIILMLNEDKASRQSMNGYKA